MGNRIIVTIGREHGSGGRSIGRILAKALNVPFYDRELISLTAKESGLAEEFIGKVEQQRHIGSYLYDMFVTANTLPIHDQVYLAQSRVIEQVARESCVIVGRCAEYILRDCPECLNVFIYAPLEERVRRVTGEYRDPVEGDPAAWIRKMDKRRASYYNYMTQRDWGKASNYDLCVNSRLGMEETADVILAACRHFRGGSE